MRKTTRVVACAALTLIVSFATASPVAAFSVLDASNYASTWTGTTVGLNWFVRHYDIRFSANYTYNNNVSGATGAYTDVARIQAQFAW